MSDRARLLTADESEPTIARYVRALARGDCPSAEAAARACHTELRRLHKGRPVQSLSTVTGYLRVRARRLRLSYSKARWRPEDERVGRRYARALADGKCASVHRAAAEWQHEAEHRMRARGTAEPRRTFYGYYSKLLALAREVGMPYVEVPWTRAEKRILERYVDRLFTGRHRRTRDATESCTRELARLRRAYHTPPRGTRVVYQELSHRVARRYLPRYSADWTPQELAIVKKFARRVEQGIYPTWSEAARASMGEIRDLYASIGRKSALRAAIVSRRSQHAVDQRFWALSHQLGLRGPRLRFWSEDERRVLERWTRRYYNDRVKKRKNALLDAAKGLRDQICRAGSKRRLSACRDKLLTMSRKLYGPGGPTPRPWTAAEDKVCDSWIPWYDRHRKTPQLHPLTEAAIGIQEELERMGSVRSLEACSERLTSRRKRWLGLA